MAALVRRWQRQRVRLASETGPQCRHGTRTSACLTSETGPQCRYGAGLGDRATGSGRHSRLLDGCRSHRQIEHVCHTNDAFQGIRGRNNRGCHSTGNNDRNTILRYRTLQLNRYKPNGILHAAFTYLKGPKSRSTSLYLYQPGHN